ncbi:MAG: helix-turn-helix transcriptional regulator [Bryobacteraceae bacterium]
MSYPFYLAENLTAALAAHDRTAFVDLVTRNFDVIMNTPSQTGTMKKLRVAQLEALITRTVYRAGAQPGPLFDISMVYLERIANLRVIDREPMREVLVEFCREAVEMTPRTSQSPTGLVQRFFQDLEKVRSEQLNVEAVARRLRVSPSHLCRAVKSAAGRTPSEFIRIRKLSHARERLATVSVTQSALETGFTKVSAFIALFRKHFGETPGEYKRRLAGGA